MLVSEIGIDKRLRRFFPDKHDKTVIVPLDDSLLSGPCNGLNHLGAKIENILSGSPNAIIGFQGLIRNFSKLIGDVPTILNLTASTTKSSHTRKVLVGSVEIALQLGADAVAVHVNISSRYEYEMLKIMGDIFLKCQNYGLPLLAIMYPRTENSDGTDNNYNSLKNTDREKYTELVAHSARVGIELGADIIKTQYTGDRSSFQCVVEACKPIPVLIAGGPVVNINEMLQMAEGAVKAGAAGISFGRNIFSRNYPSAYIKAVKEVVLNRKSAEEAEICFKSLIKNSCDN